ncbi:MAG: hypothetical protein ACRCTZ_03120 [Sarcina sp.]
MIINKFRKKLAFIGVGLVVIGIAIGFLGYAIAGFDISKFDHNGEFKWYRSTYFNESEFHIGIEN